MPIATADIAALSAAVAPYSRVLVLTHNNPDPDALAAAAGVRLLLSTMNKPAVLAYAGFLTRAQNKEMVRRLHLPFHNIANMDLRRFRACVLVDTQPGSGNNALSASHKAVGVIDHHSLKTASRACPFNMVDPSAGATSTLVYELLKAAEAKLPPNIATALFFGIKTDTADLGREATARDHTAYLDLFSQARHNKLAQIIHPRVPLSYYRTVQSALGSAVVYGDCVYAPLGEVPTPEYVSELADYLVDLSGIRWSVVTGEFKGNLYFSLRSLTARTDAGRTLRRAIGPLGFAGGHHKIAGGILNLSALDPDKKDPARDKVLSSLFSALRANTASPSPLLSNSH